MKQRHEFKTKEGWKVSVDNGIIIVENGEEKKEFNMGDIVYCDYGGLGNKSITIHRSVGYNNENHDYCSFYIKSGSLYIKHIYAEFSGYINDIKRLATEQEKQLLFDALAKDGKRWNEDTKELEDIEKRILVPECINIYRYNGYSMDDDGDKLLISFNNNNQLLGYCNGYHCVTINSHNHYELVQCELIPCKRGDLNAGDTAFSVNHIFNTNIKFDNLNDFCKIIDKDTVSYIKDKTLLCENWDNENNKWYKVVPIK